MNTKLQSFFDRAVRPFFLFTGQAPPWSASMPSRRDGPCERRRLPYLADYTIIIQHWGIMVG